jgi:hypothetical protein
MEYAMLNEIGPSYNDLAALVRKLLDRQHVADEKLRTDDHAAVKDALIQVTHSVADLSAYMATWEPSSVTPGAALIRLVMAFEDRDRGKANPLLQPIRGRGGNSLRQDVMFARVKPALAAELLFRAGRGKEEAQKEVADWLGTGHRVFKDHRGERWRIIKQWREDIDSGDHPEAAELFACLLEVALITIPTRSAEPSADDLVNAARAALGELDRYG